MLRLVLLCAVIALVKAQTTNVQRCSINEGDLPLNAHVEGCTNPPCQVMNGNDAVIHLIFKAPYLIKSMQTRVVVQVPVLGTVPYDLQEYGVTCNFLTNSYCPILPGEILQYSLRMNIPSIAPSLTVIIEFYVVDQNENTVMCIRVPVSVIT